MLKLIMTNKITELAKKNLLLSKSQMSAKKEKKIETTLNVTINSMNESNRWRVTDNLQTEEKEKKRGKEWGMGGVFKPQDAGGSKCSRCAA